MNVSIKQFGISMEIKTKGMELEVKDSGGKQLGDLVITKTRLIWCPGKTTPRKGKRSSGRTSSSI